MKQYIDGPTSPQENQLGTLAGNKQQMLNDGYVYTHHSNMWESECDQNVSDVCNTLCDKGIQVACCDDTGECATVQVKDNWTQVICIIIVEHW